MGCGASSLQAAPVRSHGGDTEPQQARGPELQAHQVGALRDPGKKCAEGKKDAELLSAPRGGSNSPTACNSPSEGLLHTLEALRSQMNQGFSRRSEAFLRGIFDKHTAAAAAAAAPGCAGLSEAGMVAALAEVGISVSAAESEHLFKTQDLNSNGCIDWSEFLSISSFHSFASR